MARFSGAAFRLVERRMTAFLVAAGVCLTLLLPGGQRAVSFTVSAPLAETVVVGQVPSLVTGLTPGP